MLDGVMPAELTENFPFSMREKYVHLDWVEGPILSELLTDTNRPHLKTTRFLELLRKTVAVEWMDIYFSSAPMTISHKSQYEEILPQADLLIRAVDGGYIYTYMPCMSETTRIRFSKFRAIEITEAPLQNLSFPR
jgi:hypothetical protein